MMDMFYRKFEERCYASRATIKDLRKQYLSFAAPIAQEFPGGNIYDAGCGRGEWLELMREIGLNPLGVDLDEGMLSACKNLDLTAEKGDAIDRLFLMEDSSQVIVSAFHVVEHIPFERLRDFITQAHRTLLPGGLLIMETPNPENIFVATKNFYLDPTHLRPIPAELLAYVAEFSGFSRVHILRLQEPKKFSPGDDISLNDVIFGVSLDYAVVAQKRGSEDIMSALDKPFSVKRGQSLHDLVNIWDGQFERLRQDCSRAQKDLEVIHSSYLWILGAPFRKIAFQIGLLRSYGARVRLKHLEKAILKKIAAYTDGHEQAKLFVIKVANFFGVEDRLSSLRRSIIGGQNSGRIYPDVSKLGALSPQAQAIYENLREDIAKSREGGCL